MSKHLLIICGPTASGKTTLAIALAKHFGTEILSADSRQVYKELKIGVARPTEEELAAVPHHFIATNSIHEPLSAGRYEQEALALLEKLFQQHDVVVMAGGSGLFIKAVTEGLDNLPASHDMKVQLHEELDERGLEWLQQEVEKLDPEYYASADQQNPRRLLRALEVIRLSGQTYSSLRTGKAKERPFRSHLYLPEWDRDVLYDRINKRVDQMMAEGQEEEARSLLPHRHLSTLHTVGYSELFDHFDGLYDLETAVALIAQHTRHYAKRQLTWFRNEAPATPVSHTTQEALEQIITGYEKM